VRCEVVEEVSALALRRVRVELEYPMIRWCQIAGLILSGIICIPVIALAFVLWGGAVLFQRMDWR